MDTPLLWHIPLSHYSEKVRALDYKSIPTGAVCSAPTT
jgi:hypothetical protein